ncbi:MAG: hypothetical protein M3Z66_21220, partial [Chloroflexota bacterium]|nr:hypothetical protein [Chloroflexota bacterium]
MKRLITLPLLAGVALFSGGALQAQHAWADAPNGPVVDVSQLRVPESAFQPAMVQQGLDREANNVAATTEFVHQSVVSDDPHWQPMR